MYLEDEAKDVYSYGALQTILFRRTPAGVTDWQWSFNGVAWYNTDDTQAVRGRGTGEGRDLPHCALQGDG
jgi:hypothetical protein